MEKCRSLYIHIPFCDTICSYCDFPKILNLTCYRETYLKRLKKEIETLDCDELDTCYIGGGTPSCLKEEELEDLLSYLTYKFKIDEEFTFECNPESLTLSKIKILVKYGVNRVSIGVQTLDDEALRYLNRHHTKKDVEKCIRELQENGITNINLDFIYGIKYDSFEKVKENIEFASKMNVTHVSYYALQFEEGTKLYKDSYRISDDDLASYYDYIVEELGKKGYYRYEVSNFAKRGFESKHNICYWRNHYYYAAGLGACSYFDNKRITRTKNISRYNEFINIYDVIEEVDKEDKEFNYLMLNLRLVKGFNKNEFEKLFNKDFEISYKKELNRLAEFFENDKEFFKVKKKYLYILDSLLVDLLHFN